MSVVWWQSLLSMTVLVLTDIATDMPVFPWSPYTSHTPPVPQTDPLSQLTPNTFLYLTAPHIIYSPTHQDLKTHSHHPCTILNYIMLCSDDIVNHNNICWYIVTFILQILYTTDRYCLTLHLSDAFSCIIPPSYVILPHAHIHTDQLFRTDPYICPLRTQICSHGI